MASSDSDPSPLGMISWGFQDSVSLSGVVFGTEWTFLSVYSDLGALGDADMGGCLTPYAWYCWQEYQESVEVRVLHQNCQDALYFLNLSENTTD